MKKFFLLAALAAMLVPFAACNQKVDYGKKTNVQIPAAKYSAQKFDLNHAELKGIEFTDGGYYVITQELTTKATIDQSQSFAYFFGPYSVDGSTYILLNEKGEKFGTVTLGQGNTITITTKNHGTIETTYTVADPSVENEFFNNIAHAWTVDKVDLSITYNGKNVGIVEDGSNLDKIAEDLLKRAEELGVEFSTDVFDPSTLDGLGITHVIFSSSNSFIICFADGSALKGDLSDIDLEWDEEDYGYGFEYAFKEEGNDLLNTSGECVFTPMSANTAWLQITVKHGDNFTGRVIFYMTVSDYNK